MRAVGDGDLAGASGAECLEGCEGGAAGLHVGVNVQQRLDGIGRCAGADFVGLDLQSCLGEVWPVAEGVCGKGGHVERGDDLGDVDVAGGDDGGEAGGGVGEGAEELLAENDLLLAVFAAGLDEIEPRGGEKGPGRG